MIKLTAIVAKRFNIAGVQKALKNGMADAADEFEILLLKPTAKWKHKPKFVRKVTANQIAITTTQDLYVWTSAGTKPHIIRPKKPGGVLAFRQQKRAKTRPNSLSSQAAQYGNQMFAQVVHHPGTKARNFPKAAHKQARKNMWARINLAMRQAAIASGHGV